MNLVHSLTPTVGVDQSLMPPPPMQHTAADESTNKKPKYKGIKMSLRINRLALTLILLINQAFSFKFFSKICFLNNSLALYIYATLLILSLIANA